MTDDAEAIQLKHLTRGFGWYMSGLTKSRLALLFFVFFALAGNVVTISFQAFKWQTFTWLNGFQIATVMAQAIMCFLMIKLSLVKKEMLFYRNFSSAFPKVFRYRCETLEFDRLTIGQLDEFAGWLKTQQFEGNVDFYVLCGFVFLDPVLFFTNKNDLMLTVLTWKSTEMFPSFSQ